jgi:hypothetical protein
VRRQFRGEVLKRRLDPPVSKKSEKKRIFLKKGVDFLGRGWYYIQAVAESDGRE